MNSKTYLITGAAQRIGAAIARHLHAKGACVALHYHTSATAATQLAAELNAIRPNSAAPFAANLLNVAHLPTLIEQVIMQFGHLDGLINNASSFYATPLADVNLNNWQELMGSNVQAPLFLAQAAAPFLQAQQGCIIGLIDIHAERPMAQHLVYNLAKAAHAQLIRALAVELAPHIRVNGVAPGVNVWPSADYFDENSRLALEATIPLNRIGTPEDIAKTVSFLIFDAPYITGEIIRVAGGRGVGL
ncbi:MAG: pteridine reductase [Neisseriaceae bacterium]|nr:pteridine reductase [Neisseriaceae bacterium]